MAIDFLCLLRQASVKICNMTVSFFWHGSEVCINTVYCVFCLTQLHCCQLYSDPVVNLTIQIKKNVLVFHCVCVTPC